MTDAGEKLLPLRKRMEYFFLERNPAANFADVLAEACRAELERAAGIADISGEPVIAAAIRKLKE